VQKYIANHCLSLPPSGKPDFTIVFELVPSKNTIMASYSNIKLEKDLWWAFWKHGQCMKYAYGLNYRGSYTKKVLRYCITAPRVNAAFEIKSENFFKPLHST